jgi:hypothetical protein
MKHETDSRPLSGALRAMAIGRIVLGVGSLVAPGATARSFGVGSAPELSYLTRVFGARAIALGAAYLLAGPRERTRLQRLCVGVDVSDTLSGLRELARRDAPRRGMATAIAITGPYAAIGATRLLSDLSGRD